MHISDLVPTVGLYDSHCHLAFREYPLSTERIVEISKENGIKTLLNVSTDIESSMKTKDLFNSSNKYIKSFIGVDPQEVIPNPEHFMGLDLGDSDFKAIKEQLREIYLNNKDSVVGIGETGMDYYWLKELDLPTQEKSKGLQKKLFILHLELSEEYKLPLTIHSRGAENECLKLLDSVCKNTKAIFHSFTGSYEVAKHIIDSGHGLGVNGIFTFKNAQNLRETYSKLLGKVSDTNPEYFYKKGIFFETDAPFLAPEGKRGEINYPYNVKEVFKIFLEYIANA